MSELRAHKFLVLPAFILFFSSAGAQQPNDVVISDSNGNTAAGTDALQSLTIRGVCAVMSGATCLVYQATGNTAVGSQALAANTTAPDNTAIGTAAGARKTPINKSKGSLL